jgi:hypothetical protein
MPEPRPAASPRSLPRMREGTLSNHGHHRPGKSGTAARHPNRPSVELALSTLSGQSLSSTTTAARALGRSGSENRPGCGCRGHAKTVDARGLIRQRLLMGLEPQVDDVADAQRVDVGQLRLGRLTGCGYPVIEPSPVVYGIRVGHHSLDFGFSERARRGTRLTGADSFPRRSKSYLPGHRVSSRWPCRTLIAECRGVEEPKRVNDRSDRCGLETSCQQMRGIREPARCQACRATCRGRRRSWRRRGRRPFDCSATCCAASIFRTRPTECSGCRRRR